MNFSKDLTQPATFAIGYAALFIALIMVVDFGGDTGEVAAALAVLLAGSATVVLLPNALKTIGNVTSIK